MFIAHKWICSFYELHISSSSLLCVRNGDAEYIPLKNLFYGENKKKLALKPILNHSRAVISLPSDSIIPNMLVIQRILC